MALTFTYSGNVYGTGSAGQTTFPLVSTAGNNIPYLLPAHIHAYFSTDNQQTWNELARPGEWDFNDTGTAVVLAAPLPAATELLIRRITPPLDPFVNFQPSSLLTAEQLNEAERFSLYLDQELKDAVDIDSAGSLIFKGLIDLTADNAPLAPQVGWTYYNTGAGTVIQGGTPGWVGITGDAVLGGEQVIYDGTNWTIPDPIFGVQQVTGTAPITVDNTDGQRPIVGITAATTSAAGSMSGADKTKLDGIASGAEVNVQSDWNEADTGSDAFIQNKPTIPSGYWDRTGTVLSPATAGDTIATNGGAVSLDPGTTGSPLVRESDGTVLIGQPSWQNDAASVVRVGGSVLVKGDGTAPNAFGVLSGGNSGPRFSVTGSGLIKSGSNVDQASTTAVSLDPGTTGSPLVRDSNGQLGVGVATPGAKLHVSGGDVTFQAEGASASQNLFIVATNNAGSQGSIARITAAPSPGAGATAATDLQFATRNAAGAINVNATIDSTGRLGVGTATPETTLRVNGTTSSPQQTITAGAFDLATGNFWTAGGITVPNPTNAVAGTSGVIVLTGAPTGWGANFAFPGGTPPTVTTVPAVIPFYVQDPGTILMGNVVEGIA